ncbi:S8 family serine peptidase [bacterium]|nr:S8 family serine peptidase [bacterium]
MFLTMAAAAQPNAAGPRERDARIQALRGTMHGAALGPQLRLSLSKEHYLRSLGTPPGGAIAVDGAGLSPEGQARAFLDQWGDLFFKKTSDIGFKTVKINDAGKRSHVRMSQTFRGLPVFASGVTVQVNKAAGVESVFADVLREAQDIESGKLSTTPAVSADAARKTAIALMAKNGQGKTLKASVPELVIYDPKLLKLQDTVQVAWQTIVTDSADPTVREQVLVNAQTGAVALHYTLIMDAKNRMIYNANNVPGVDPGTLVRSEGQPASGVSDADLAYTYFGDTYDYYYRTHGRDSLNNAGYTLSGTVLYCPAGETPPYGNAFWDGSRMYFGQGFSAADDVVAHELTHGVTQYESNLNYYGQSGAINESFSDMWGEWIDLTNGSGTDTDAVRWLLGEDIPGVGVIRNMKNPPAYNDPDRMGSPLWYSGTGDNGGVHTNSGVGNKLAYLLSDGDTFNLQTISALGITTTSQLMYECQANLLTVSSDYAALSNALAQAAINLGYSAAVRDNIDRACIATEIKDLPDNVSSVRAVSGTGNPNISLTWVNPTASGFQSVVIRRGTTSYPVTPAEGTAVYSGAGSACTDGPLTIGNTYYYSIWAYYGGTSYSYAAHVQATAGSEVPDWFTELFDAADNDLDNHKLTLTPGSAVNTYTAASEAAASFPTDPTGGTMLSLSDDSYAYCSLTDGKQILLYGTAYSGFYVGSNGYITFGSGDSSYGESFTNHFAKPRIAGHYDDLSPASNVSWRQLTDRAVVTWNQVREYGGTTVNSFQIEMFFDGKITITWLAMGATDGLAGVSAGSGVPSGFVESDLTAYPAPVYDDLQVYPLTPVSATGYEGGPFTPSQVVCTLTNRSTTNSLPWSASFSAPWMTVTPAGGTLPAGGTVDVTIQFNAATNQLAAGAYSGVATFRNLTSNHDQTRSVALNIAAVYGYIGVSDSIPPSGDLAMPFGQLEVGRLRTEHVTLTNTDTAHSLIISNISLNGYLLEDFNDGLAQGWTPEVPSQWEVIDNKYRAQAGTGLRVQSIYSDQTWTDCSAQVTMTRTGYMSSAQDLVVRASSDFSWRDGTGSGYGLGISGDGSYYVIKWVSGSYTFLKDWTSSSYLQTGGAANVMRMVVQGTSIKVYANGNLLWSGTDSSVPGPGRVGVLGYTGSESATIHYFDDVLVESGATATGAISPEQAAYNRQSYAGAGDPTRVPGDWKRPAAVASRIARLAAPIQPQVVSPFTLGSLPTLPVTLGPSQSLTFDVIYAPTTIEQHRNMLRIESNDVIRPRVLVDLTGEGIADRLSVNPNEALESGGHPGGPFTPASKAYQLANTGTSSINWSAAKTAAWLTLSSAGGTLPAGGQATLTVSINSQANSLAEGNYSDDVTITNTTSGASQIRHVTLSVFTSPEVWVNPAALTQTLTEGAFTTRTLQIGNSGDRVLNFTLTSQETSRTTSVRAVIPAADSQPPAGHSFTKLAKGVAFEPNRLLVRFDPSVSPANRAGVLASAGGGTIVTSYTIVPGLALVKLPQGMAVEDALVKYNGAAGIKYAEPDYELKAFAKIPNDTRFSELWGMHNTGQTGGTADADIDAPEAWDIHTGTGNTVVAVIDTGIDYTHPDLASNMWTNPGEIAGNGIDDDGNGYIDDVNGYDFYNSDGNPMDDHGHGTHCSGTIGARGNDGIGVAGVSWRVKLMAIKFLSSSGSGSTSGAILSVQYATAMGAKIMSNSWGGGSYNQSLKDAIDAAGARNMLFIAAAGNDSGNNNDINPVYPCSYTSDNIISVMSTTNTDARSSFSNFGPTSVDLGAPGSSILSCAPGGGYATMSGTSMATPHVSGGAALVWSLNPTLTYSEVKRILMQGVDPTLSGQCASGGRMNIAKAIGLAGEPWIRLRPDSGSVATGSSTNIDVGLYATDLTPGQYFGEIIVSSDDSNTPQLNVPVHLTVVPDFLTMTPTSDYTMTRYLGTPADPSEQTSSTLSNTGTTVSWTAASSEPWLTLEPASGQLSQGQSTLLHMRLNSAVSGLAIGEHVSTVTVTNTTTGKSMTRKIKVNVIPTPPLPAVPNNPTPEDGATGVALDATLSWNTFFHVIEDFEDSSMSEYYGTSGGTNTIVAAAAHDGALGLAQDSEWIYRTDSAVTVAQGQMISYWIKPRASGRIYCGFGASSSGTYSVVAGMNSNEFLLQLNNGWGYLNLASATQSWIYNRWYRVEIEWASGGSITARLYDYDGTTLLNTIKASDNTYTSGGIAFRSFGAQHYIDTITRSRSITARAAEYVNGLRVPAGQEITAMPAIGAAFSPVVPLGSTLINFDDVTAPSGFSSTTRLTTRYTTSGVTFSGPGGNDGGAILNESGNFGVSGHSSPNFLAFNTGATLSDGGVPRGPELLTFDPPVSSVQMLVGAGSNTGPITLVAYDAAGLQVDTAQANLSSAMTPVSVEGLGIVRVALSFQGSLLVIDNLVFNATSSPGTGDVTYDVFLDTGVTTPTTLIYSGAANSCRPQPSLLPNTLYRWRVVARNVAGSTYGPVWSFRTTDIATSGTLRTTINPAWAVQDGAKWHLRPIEETPNPVVWHDSGETVSYPSGSYSLAFKPLTGWTQPAEQPVTISMGIQQSKVGIYNPRNGNLTVTVNPPACSSASWHLKGREEAPNPIVWHNGGATVAYPAGTYTLTFQPKTGWVTPADQTVAITESGNATAYATYGSTPGSRFVIELGAGYNPVGPAVNVGYTAQGLIDDINSDGGTAVNAYRYLGTGGWQSHADGSSSNNFNIQNGAGYFVKTGTASQWIQESPAITSPLLIGLAAGYNPIALPGWAPNTKAEALGIAINQQGGSVTEVIRFVRETGLWQSHIMGRPFSNFDVNPGVCYIVKCTGSSTYTLTAPAQAQPAAEPEAQTETGPQVSEPAGVMPVATTTPVQVSNVTQNSFTVSWTTDANATGSVEFGTTAGLGRSATDVRGVATSSSTHFVNVTGLEANTRYYFDVITNGVRDNNGGAHYSVMTGADIGLPPFGNAYGQVYIYNHVNLAYGTIVHVQVEDQNGAGTAGRSGMLSALVTEGGYWCVPLGSIRASGGGSFFSYSNGDKLIVEARGGTLGAASLVLDVIGACPVDDLVLNRSPKAVNESVSTTQNTALTIPVLANDSDPDGDPLSITSVTNPAHGTTFTNVNGTITYRPVTNYYGTDSFQYTISDGRGGSATATVTVTVNQLFLPVAIAKAPYSDNIICVGHTETLDGSSSYDPRGRALTYQWSIVKSPAGSKPVLGGATSSKATLKTDMAGYYKLRLVVNNGSQTGYADLLLDARWPAPLTADFNGDNKVDVLDLLIILSHFTSKGKPYDARYDLNHDGKIDSADWKMVVLCFGQTTYPQRTAASPRPQATFTADVTLLASSPVVRQGETFTVAVHLKGYTIGAVQLGLAFDDKCLSYISWQDLNLLSRGESGDPLRVQTDVGPASQSCTSGIVRGSLTGFSGEGKVLMFTLKALPNAPVGPTKISVRDALIATPAAVAQTVNATAVTVRIANSNAAEWWQLYE